jgi:hypothetical protein
MGRTPKSFWQKSKDSVLQPRRSHQGKFSLWFALACTVFVALLQTNGALVNTALSCVLYFLLSYWIAHTIWFYWASDFSLRGRAGITSIAFAICIGLGLYGSYCQYKRDHPPVADAALFLNDEATFPMKELVFDEAQEPPTAAINRSFSRFPRYRVSRAMFDTANVVIRNVGEVPMNRGRITIQCISAQDSCNISPFTLGVRIFSIHEVSYDIADFRLQPFSASGQASHFTLNFWGSPSPRCLWLLLIGME